MHICISTCPVVDVNLLLHIAVYQKFAAAFSCRFLDVDVNLLRHESPFVALNIFFVADAAAFMGSLHHGQ